MINKIDFPNPAFIREDYTLFNDGWQFSFDQKEWQPINLPFSPESSLSGISVEKSAFLYQCYYRKSFSYHPNGKRVLIRFGAVDYRTVLLVNGKYAGMHVGGYTSFHFDITDLLKDGDNLLELTVYDDPLASQPHGKQCHRPLPVSCLYTRTTGIWQSVWLEYAPAVRVEKIFLTPNAEKGYVKAEVFTNGVENCKITVSYAGKTVGLWKGQVGFRKKIKINLSEKHLWEIDNGLLYDVEVRYGEDEVHTYFGLRDACYKGYDFLLNGKPVFQKLVLDQGFYPDGVITAPSVDAMQKDIELGRRLGFNGARLHMKVFDPRHLYLCDKAGYMVWGEFPNWGMDVDTMDYYGQFLSEWCEAMTRDFNHPSIITWCPLNEVRGDLKHKQRDPNFLTGVYEFTKKFDPSRPCVDASGGHHGYKTDLFDFHYYATREQTVAALDRLEKEDILVDGDIYLYNVKDRIRYKKGLPVNLSEYGGFAFKRKAADGELFAYGNETGDGDEFVKSYREVTEILFQYKKLSGFCYTQLYDVEQEQNGFYYYDRTDKLTEAQKDEIRKINSIR